MPDRVLAGPVENNSCERPKCVKIHTRKIFDACRDKDCIEDLRVYPTVSSQVILDSAFSVRPESARLVCADVNLDEISFNRGYYTVDVTYFYRITGQTFPGGIPITGLAVFDKRVILYGGEGNVKSFSSRRGMRDCCANSDAPEAIVEAVDPIALNLRIGDRGHCGDRELRNIPPEILEILGEELNLGGNGRPLFVTLGQFSIIRLERDAQLLLHHAECFYPDRECVGAGGDDDPCTLFGRVRFPMEEFFPCDTRCDGERNGDLVQ